MHQRKLCQVEKYLSERCSDWLKNVYQPLILNKFVKRQNYESIVIQFFKINDIKS